MNSKEKLAQALQQEYDKAIVTCETKYIMIISGMIKQAGEGYYSDYDSPLATPCIQLVKDLTDIGLIELAERAKNGEFDATKEESDEWYQREGRALLLEIARGNEEVANTLFGKLSKEERQSKEGIKGWDI